MKISVKLITYNKVTKNGFPVVLQLAHKTKRKKKVLGYSDVTFWNFDTQLPLKSHPDYVVLMSEILEAKALITKVHVNKLSFDHAVKLLFSTKKQSEEFYKACLQFCDSSTTGKLYQTVLNSFNKVFPGVLITELTQDHAKQYMAYLLKTNTANGVHAYMRTLNALYNKLTPSNNPFKGVRPKKVKTKSKALTDNDVVKLITTRCYIKKYDGKNTVNTVNYERYYWLLMFYLGGIDFVDLAALRYDIHVVDGRIQFYRNKGGTNVFVNNIILPEAKALLKLFDCKPYLVPIYKYKDYHSYLSKCNSNLHERTADLNLTVKPTTKSARYTFITRAQQLLIDERITIEIVGHAQQSTHSIYTNEFPLSVRDKAHKKIINLLQPNHQHF